MPDSHLDEVPHAYPGEAPRVQVGHLGRPPRRTGRVLTLLKTFSPHAVPSGAFGAVHGQVLTRSTLGRQLSASIDSAKDVPTDRRPSLPR